MSYTILKNVLMKIKSITDIIPEVGIILGSGLGGFADLIENKIEIPYSNLPGFPVSTVPGHDGKLIIGKLCSKNIVAFKGRVHYYEGKSPQEIALLPRTAAALGVKVLIITNAAGGIDDNFQPGNVVIIKDHINLSGFNPLRGKYNPVFGPQFVDLSNAYDEELRKLMAESAKQEGIDIAEGVYTILQGPNYETPAEIRMLKSLGSQLVGMSTVPEVITAKQCGLKVAALSCVTNKAAGLPGSILNHEDVQKVANAAGQSLQKIILKFLQNLKIDFTQKNFSINIQDNEIDWDLLNKKGLEAFQKAYAPYSNYHVGAALLCEDGEIFIGCNVENSAYGDTICAERVALGNAVVNGHRKFKALLIVTKGDNPAYPCGSCRQALSEFGLNLPIMVTTIDGKKESGNLSDLFPHVFDSCYLK